MYEAREIIYDSFQMTGGEMMIERCCNLCYNAFSRAAMHTQIRPPKGGYCYGAEGQQD